MRLSVAAGRELPQPTTKGGRPVWTGKALRQVSGLGRGDERPLPDSDGQMEARLPLVIFVVLIWLAVITSLTVTLFGFLIVMPDLAATTSDLESRPCADGDFGLPAKSDYDGAPARIQPKFTC